MSLQSEIDRIRPIMENLGELAANALANAHGAAPTTPPRRAPNQGHRKPNAKRATLCLRLTESDRDMIRQQAISAGLSIPGYLAGLARSAKPVENSAN